MTTKGQVLTPNNLIVKDVIKDIIDKAVELSEKSHRSKQVFISKIGNNNSSTWYVQGSVNPYDYPDSKRKEIFKCIHDPGAMATILSKHVYDSLPESARPVLESCDLKVFGANGHPIHLYGQAEISLEINGKLYRHNVIVCDLQDEIILGSDFIYDAHDCEMKIESVNSMRKRRSDRRKCIWIIDPNDPVNINKVKLHTYKPVCKGVNLVTIKRIILEPGQDYLVRTRVDDYINEKDKFMITNAQRLPSKPELDLIQVANTLATPKDGEAIVVLTNVKNTKMTLEEGTPVASLQKVTNCHISKPIKDRNEKSTMCSNKSVQDNTCEESSKITTPPNDETTPPEKKKRNRRRRTKVLRIRQINIESDTNILELPVYLHDLYRRSSEHLTQEQKNRLKNILQNSKEYFAQHENDYGKTDIVTHDIDTGDTKPIRQKCRHPPLALQDQESDLVDDMQNNDQIEPSQSPWASPVVMVKKKDGSTRFCIDYRKLNEATVKDAYPLPNIQDCLNTLQEGNYFCTIDLKSGYWHIKLTERAKERSAFVCRQGLFQWKVMPFGLCNAPATFERLMETVLKGKQWKTCLVYLDDVIVFGRTFQECASRLEEVLKCLGKAGLKMKPKKCHFFQKRLSFLGHIVSGEGIETDPEKVEQIKNYPRPREGLKLGNKKIPFVTQIKQFLGMCSYYRKFIEKFAVIAEPLQRYTRQGADLTWTPEADLAFNTLKKALITSPVLAYPVKGRTYYVDTDACNFAMGAVLSQRDEYGKEHPILYVSKTFSAQERNYCIWRKEFLAVCKALKIFEPYIIGQDVIVRTDNIAVTRMMKMQNLNAQSASMVAYIDQLNVQIKHRKGREHVVPDTLSRKPENYNEIVDNHRCKQCTPHTEDKVSVETQTCDEDFNHHMINRVVTRSQAHTIPQVQRDATVEGWDIDEIKHAYDQDIDLVRFIEYKRESDKRPHWRKIARYSYHFKVLWGEWDSFELHDGLIFKKKEKNDEFCTKLVLPAKLRRKAFDSLHCTRYGGHLGYRRTLGKVKYRFYWPRMAADVKLWVQQCDDCYVSKPLNRTTHTRLQVVQVGEPLDRTATDVMGPLPKTKNRNQYVLVIGDYFTKWIEAIPVPNFTAKTCADAILHHFILKFGVPLSIHSDQGQNFCSRIWKELCTMLQMKKTKTTSHYPQSNGFIERFNRTLASCLRACKEKDDTEWDELVPLLAMAYRSSVQESSGVSPNLAMLGREINLPIDVAMPKYEPDPPVDPDPKKKKKKGVKMTEYCQILRDNMRKIHEIVRQNTTWSMQRQKQQYDATSDDRKEFKQFDLVWWNIVQDSKNINCRKLTPLRKGPYMIERSCGDVKFYVRTGPRTAQVIHRDKLLPYKGIEVPKWMENAKKRIIERSWGNRRHAAQQWDSKDFKKYLNSQNDNN